MNTSENDWKIKNFSHLQVFVLTIKDYLGGDVNTVLLRLNLLLDRGYYMDTSKDVYDTVWLSHFYKKELDLILYPDGLLVEKKPSLLGVDEDRVRIYEEDHEEFLKFLETLPKVNLFHRMFSIFYRGGL